MSRTLDTFLRSINLRMDIDHADRFAHFRPTRKSASVTDAIARGVPNSASMIVAAYGSGKSIAAGTGALLVENAPDAAPVLERITDRLEATDPACGGQARRRLETGERGAVIVIEGSVDSPATTLRQAAEARLGKLSVKKGAADADPTPVLEAIAAKCRTSKRDRVAIIWDEFGRHLEALAAAGRAEDLSAVQQIAEWAVRQDAPEATFTVLLHQGFFHYAGSLSQTARNDWRKIEGRFSQIRFVDDSKEMHQLIAWVVEQSRPTDLELPAEQEFAAAATEAKELGLFDGFTDTDDLSRTLRSAYPLAPAVLHLLPRLAARMAQNERTTFSFINSIDLSQPVRMLDLFDAFSEAMRADIGAGGAHRRWLEAQTALSKTTSPEEAEAIAGAALLGLGHAGQRTRLSKNGLVFALDTYGQRQREEAERAVDTLIERKLLLYRERTDDISVWHGTDLDLRGKLEEEKLRQDPHFDLVAYLDAQHPAEAWKPVEHNIRFDIRRYFSTHFISASDLRAGGGSEHPLFHLAPGEDGRIIYALPDTTQDLEDLRFLADEAMSTAADAAVVLAYPTTNLAVREVALEAACLDSLKNDSELIGKDPFALTEIQHMADAAHESLRRQLARLVRPSRDVRWCYRRGTLNISRDVDLRNELTRIADARFPKTPHINNEVVVRKTLSRPMVNARKKVELGILERSEQPHLNFDPKGTTPFVSILRTVLERPGIYRERAGAWGWADPSDLADPGLAEVWALIRDFFQTPGAAKPPRTELIDKLQRPPYGVRFGIIPVLVAAGLKAFGRVIAIRKNGVYLSDVLASEIEDLCANPDAHEIEVLELDGDLADYLDQMTEIFGADAAGRETDRLRRAWDALTSWADQLPPSALRTRNVGASAKDLQAVLRDMSDPVHIFTRQFPAIAGADRPTTAVVEGIDEARRDLEAIVVGYQRTAIETIRVTIALANADTDDDDTLARAQAWADCIDETHAAMKALDGTQRAILQQAKRATTGRHTEASFGRAISNILIGKDFDQWDDRTPRQFASMLRSAIHQIESVALNAEQPTESLKPLLETRIDGLVRQMRQVASDGDIERLLRRLADTASPEKSHQESNNGKPERRAS